jgi:hypothetical protein
MVSGSQKDEKEDATVTVRFESYKIGVENKPSSDSTTANEKSAERIPEGDSLGSDDPRQGSVHSSNSDSKPTDNSRLLQTANYWDVLAFGICLVSANLTYGAWHDALLLGFWSFFFSTLIMSSVFMIFV